MMVCTYGMYQVCTYDMRRKIKQNDSHNAERDPDGEHASQVQPRDRQRGEERDHEPGHEGQHARKLDVHLKAGRG